MAGKCTCEEQCPESPSCACIYTYDDDRCNCDCEGVIIIHSPRALALDARVDVSTGEDVDLAQIGEILGKLCAADVLIPAAAASEKVPLQLKYATLADVIETAGLVVSGGGQSDAGTSY